MANAAYTFITLPCPRCAHDTARTVISSYSIITVACVRCTHQWTVEIAGLPNEVRKQIPNVEGREQYRQRTA
jgi:transcription elongation factor Elf1